MTFHKILNEIILRRPKCVITFTEYNILLLQKIPHYSYTNKYQTTSIITQQVLILLYNMLFLSCRVFCPPHNERNLKFSTFFEPILWRLTSHCKKPTRLVIWIAEKTTSSFINTSVIQQLKASENLRSLQTLARFSI